MVGDLACADVHAGTAGDDGVGVVDEGVCAQQDAACPIKRAPIDFVVVDDLMACAQFGQCAIDRAVVGDGVNGVELGVVGDHGCIGFVGDVLTIELEGVGGAEGAACAVGDVTIRINAEAAA